MHLVFAAHADNTASQAACRRMMVRSEQAGFRCSLLSDGTEIGDESAVMIAVGGDGNFIRTAHKACEWKLPLFGVNLGHVGFLTEWIEADFDKALALLQSGEYGIRDVPMIHACVNGSDVCDSFNDLIVYKQTFSGVTRISIAIDGQSAGDLRGDGIIVATAVGATGYSLSSGGPILADGLNATVVTPICAHTLHFRPVVASTESVIEMTMHDVGSLASDGDRIVTLHEGDRITVSRSKLTVRLLTFRKRNLFQLISDKLM